MSLKGFKKVFLKAGRSETVKLTIDKAALSFWDEKSKQWDAEQGAFKALVGSSSRDIELQAEFTYQ